MSEGTPYRRMVDKAFAKAIPLAAQFEITYRCNHLCTFCYNSPTGQKEMTTPQIFDALRKVADFGVLYLTLTGGEAMCHRDFWAIAEETRRLGMALRLYSNGYLMADPAVVARVAGLHPMEVEISIHGSRPESHEALTKIKGSFAKTVKALENLVEAGIKINVKCPITRLNQDELFEIRDIGDRLGVFITFDAVITPKDDGDLSHMHLRPDDAFLEKYWGEWYGELHRGKLPPKTNHCASDGASAVCGSGRSGFTLDPYGNILPCVAFRRKVANILEIESLHQIWHTSPVLNGVRDLAVEARQRLDQHENGPYFTFCMGVAEAQLGDPLAIYPQADINAKAVKRAYTLLQIGQPITQKSA
ncbi:MAG TPA: radical SAM protein [Candidatus Polarisedimenticolaceae bacterium]|nr:radical SAM protein [Candidatus Polarisedimenticolaceae bacterium]